MPPTGPPIEGELELELDAPGLADTEAAAGTCSEAVGTVAETAPKVAASAALRFKSTPDEKTAGCAATELPKVCAAETLGSVTRVVTSMLAAARRREPEKSTWLFVASKMRVMTTLDAATPAALATDATMLARVAAVWKLAGSALANTMPSCTTGEFAGTTAADVVAVGTTLDGDVGAAADTDTDGEGVPRTGDSDGEPEGDTEPLGVEPSDSDGVGVTETVPDAVAEIETVVEAVVDGDGETEGVRVVVGEGVAVMLGVSDTEADCETVGVTEIVALGDGVSVAEVEGVGEGSGSETTACALGTVQRA